MRVIVELGFVVTTGMEEDMVVETVQPLAGTMAVNVGVTAFACPTQMRYAEVAVLSQVEQDAYMHERQTSPSDSPVKL